MKIFLALFFFFSHQALAGQDGYICTIKSSSGIDTNGNLVSKNTSLPSISSKFAVDRSSGKVIHGLPSPSGQLTLISRGDKSNNFKVLWIQKNSQTHSIVSYLEIKESMGKHPTPFFFTDGLLILSGLCE
jgi:hypothetical protein